ncbi:MAG: DHHA1 domain-containing protein [Candidatus Nanohaloarchaea archaeon]|nr:DHHA1 domain-containing protein [Candidatus Nanohaloarchaea archaeon]
MYTEAVDYLEAVEEGENVLIVHHWDMDGSCAAAITSKVIEEVRGTGADFVTIPADRKHQVGRRAERIIEQEQVERLIVLDMSVPSDRVEELHREHDVEILIVDHHDFDEDLEDAVFVNPRLDDPDAYVPAAKLCNDISKEFGLDLDWIAGMGIIQDFAVEAAPELFERLAKLYPKYFPDELTQDNLAKSCTYGRYASVLNVKTYKDTEDCAVKAFKALTRADGLKYLESREEYQELLEYYEEMQDEFTRIKERFEDEKEVYEDEKLVFFEFESPYHINSAIATQVSLEKEDWAYIIAKREGDRINVSSRCQDGRLDLGSLLREALPEDAGENAEAGGHRVAAGASFDAGRLEAFKQNLLDAVGAAED